MNLSPASPVTIESDGHANVTATANAIGGQYTVSASTAGAAAPASFILTNIQTTLVVNTLADDPSGPTPGYTTLRDAISLADADTANQYVITFSVMGTIDLLGLLPKLDGNIVINGPGAATLKIQPNPSDVDPVFVVEAGDTANTSLSGMTITGGEAARRSRELRAAINRELHFHRQHRQLRCSNRQRWNADRHQQHLH